MGIEVSMKRRRFGGGVVFILCIFVSLLFSSVESNVVLVGRNVTLSLESMEANFAVQIKNSGECGVLYIAEPIDACSPLTNKIVPVEGAARSPYVLIVRGGCTFEDKVRRAQNAGFEAAIIYDNEYDDRMIASKFYPLNSSFVAFQIEAYKCLHATLFEALRLCPAIPVDAKSVFSDDTLPDGLSVKKGDMVAY